MSPCLSLGQMNERRLTQSGTSRGSSMPDVVARLDLPAINEALIAVESDWPRIDAELARLKFGRKDSFTAVLFNEHVHYVTDAGLRAQYQAAIDEHPAERG